MKIAQEYQGLHTLAHAEQVLNVSYGRLWYLIKKNKIEPFKLGNQVILSQDELDRLKLCLEQN